MGSCGFGLQWDWCWTLSKLLASASASGTVGPTSGGWRIGGTGASSAHNLNGTVDEVAIWNRSLSISEIQDHYQNGIWRNG